MTSLNEKDVVHSQYPVKRGEVEHYLKKPFLYRLYKEMGLLIFVLPWILMSGMFILFDLKGMTIYIALYRMLIVGGLLLIIQPVIILVSRFFDKKKKLLESLADDTSKKPICAYFDPNYNFTYFTDNSFFIEKPRVYVNYIVSKRIHVSDINYDRNKNQMDLLWNNNTVSHNFYFTFPKEWGDDISFATYMKIKNAFLICKSAMLQKVK